MEYYRFIGTLLCNVGLTIRHLYQNAKDMSLHFPKFDTTPLAMDQSNILYKLLAGFETHVEPLDRVCECAHRDEVNAAFAIITQGVNGDSA